MTAVPASRISDTTDAIGAITGIERDPAKSMRPTDAAPAVASASRDREVIA
jgi:hypothetical protein